MPRAHERSASSPFLLEGRITIEGRRGHGVPGLLAELWTKGEGGGEKLGSAYTDADGRFSALVADTTRRGDAPGEIAVFDRGGAVLYRRGVASLGPGRRQIPPVRIAEESLTRHLAEPVLLDPGTALIDVDGLLSSFEGLVRDAFPEWEPEQLDGLLSGVRCPLPTMHFMAELGRSAFGALAGDPEAIELFVTLVNELEPPREPLLAVEREGCGCGGALESRSFAATGPGLPEQPFLPLDGALPIIAAAAHLQASGLFGEDLLGRALRPICGLETIGRLHRLAVGAGSPEIMRDRLGAMLSPTGFFPECPPVQIPEVNLQLTCEPFVPCGDAALEAFGSVSSYLITGVSMAVACPGDVITITGSGFGSTAGRVSFGGVETAATTWTDTSITVTVPPGARNPLALVLPKAQRLICGRLVEVTPSGTITANFEVGVPEVQAFFVGSPWNRPFCVEPGDPIPLSWRVRGTTKIRVEVLDAQNNVLFVSDPAPRHGIAAQLNAPATNWTRVLRARLTAEGRCGPTVVDEFLIYVTRRPALSIDGLEVTQAIQHYHAALHLTDTNDRGPDNSLRLVTNKTAWVRAYLRSGQLPTFEGGNVPGVDGTLTVERRVGGVWSVVATIASQNGPIGARAAPAYDDERGNIARTLNFVVPAAEMTGQLRLTVDVAYNRPCQSGEASRSIEVDVNLQQTLNAAFITIGYQGPDATGSTTMLNLPAPTLAECQAETGWTMRVYPVSGAPNVRIAGTFVTTTPLDDARSCPGCCSPNWGPLLTQVETFVTADQQANPNGNWVYYGLINNGIPVNVPGCNGVATGGLQGQQMTYAHEIGHQFGLPHARCGNAGAGNAAYPVYEPYDLPVDVPAMNIGDTVWTMASIGEYGLDIDNGNIANPNDAEDFMSYCGPRWISVFTHNFLVNRAGLTPLVIGTGEGAGSERVVRDEAGGFVAPDDSMRPRIAILGYLDSDGTPEVTSVARLDARYAVGRGVRTDLRAQLLDADGTVLSEDTVYRYPSAGCGDGGQPCCEECAESRNVVVKALLDDRGRGDKLRLVRGDEVVWTRSRPGAPPKIREVRASVRRGVVRVSWSCARGAVDEAWVRWSVDAGKTWRALTIVRGADSVEVGADQLPPGSVRFQVLAHDGFSTTTATSRDVELPASPPQVSIIYPRETDLAYDERFLHLWGVASRPGGEPFDPDAYIWRIDGREVGRGPDIWVENPGAGQHELRLRVSDRGGAGTARSSFEVLPTTREDESPD
jgi:hypothetical protein